MLGWKKHRLEEAQAGIKIAGRNINNLRYADDTTLMAESEEELKKPLDESERGEWKTWLKAQHSENEDHGIWSHHFMANRWGNNGNSDRLYFLGLHNHLWMVTAALKLKDACSLEGKLWATWKKMKGAQLCLTLCDPMDYSPGQNTRVGSLSLLQGIFPTQGSNLSLLLGRWILYQGAMWEAPGKEYLSIKLVPRKGESRSRCQQKDLRTLILLARINLCPWTF